MTDLPLGRSLAIFGSFGRNRVPEAIGVGCF